MGGMDNERRDYDLYAANRTVGFASKSAVAEGEVGGRYRYADAIMPMSEEMAAAPGLVVFFQEVVHQELL